MKLNAHDNRFRILHNGISPRKGYVLIAEPFLNDSYFYRSVVFLTEHDKKNGTMGFVLNKPVKVTLTQLFPDIPEKMDFPLFLGGPVGGDKLFFLHTLDDILPDALHISDSIYMNGNFELLCEYVNQGYSVKDKVKFFLGYSGWDSEQLNDEIKTNTWLVNRMDEQDIFLNQDELLWKKSLSSLDNDYKMWMNYPKNPQMN